MTDTCRKEQLIFNINIKSNGLNMIPSSHSHYNFCVLNNLYLYKQFVSL